VLETPHKDYLGQIIECLWADNRVSIERRLLNAYLCGEHELYEHELCGQVYDPGERHMRAHPLSEYGEPAAGGIALGAAGGGATRNRRFTLPAGAVKA
jgi:hypothetical protein